MRQGRFVFLIAPIVVLSGCAQPASIGSELWLDYNGDHRDAVIACAKGVPETIRSPMGYPGGATVREVSVEATQVDDVLTRFTVRGDIELDYGADGILTYRWSCEASERTSVIRTTTVTSELVETP